MPINLASFIQPRNATNPDPQLRGTYYLLEDIYLKGGLQLRANAADRDSINTLNRKEGMLVMTLDDKKLWMLNPDLTTWVDAPMGGGGKGQRQVAITMAPVIANGTNDFDLVLGKSCMLMKLSVSEPCVVEIHSTVQRMDTNPYKFIASATHLQDDGTTIMADDTVVKNRRYSLLCNLEDPINDRHYFRVIEQDGVPKNVQLTATFLPFE